MSHDDVLSLEGLELLDLLLEEQGIETGPPGERIGRRDDPAELPLSFAQQRLWFLDQWRPRTPDYNISSAFRLEGALDPGVLARALSEVGRRHEVLRCVLRTVDGKPVQVLLPPAPFLLPVVDLEGMPEAEALRLVGEEARRPFDLATGPLLRATVLRLGDREHVLLLTQHHVVSDGWSMGVFVREVVTLYGAFAAGRPSPLPELPIQYADFATWQRRRLQGESLEELLGWWRERLAGAPELLELPADRPRPPVQGWAGGTLSFVLAAEARDALDTLARREGATLFMVLLAAFDALLQRYTGRDDIVVGSPVANRNRDETEGLIGFFVNTLVLRADLSGDPTFRELVGRVRDVTLGVYDHQDVPFEMLVDDLDLAREVSHTPLFQVVFTLQNASVPTVEVPELSLTPLPAHSGTSKFDLTLSMTDLPGGLAGSFEYSIDLFDRATIKRLADHFRTLLEGIAAGPDRRLSELPLLTTEERSGIEAWSAAEAAFPVGESLHRRFEAQAARTPGATAVTGEGKELTYAELDAFAGRLAARLRALGVGPESRVGLLAERTPILVAGVLGILKAGGAYVPLDPAHPDDRLAYTVTDSGARVVVAGAGLEERLSGLDVQVVSLEDEAGESAPSVEVDPGQAAYVIYTSGSTGCPKGVVVTHANVLRLFAATDGWFGFGPEDVWTLFHSYAFDFSVWEIWGALLYGGRLVVVPYLVSRSPEAFLRLLAEERVTVLNQTPSAFRQLIQTDRAAPSELALRWVVFGGEALDLKSLAPWFERHGGRTPRLVNMYGITETTVHVTYRPVGEADLAGGSVLGRPIPDLSLHLLDRYGSLVPVGVPGEMHVGGAGLARGYLGRPALTAERFVPDAFGNVPGARLYRSGDLAHRRPDGDLEYLGRIDYQVKVRGFRIELGEIEVAIAERPEVRQAVVLAREEGGETRLTAYVVPSGEGLSTAALREELRRRLPDYMVPAAWVVLDALPLTPNGKLDRRALPAPGPALRDLDEDFAAPSTPTEELLAAVWAQVLGVDRVGVRDNFFALGGDSIRSIQVISLARERGLELSVQDLFQHQTIAELAAVAGLAGAVDAEQGLVTGPVPLAPIQQRFLGDDPVDAHHFNQSLLLQSGQALDPVRLEQVIGHLLAHHDALRLRFVREREGWLQRNDPTGPVPFHRMDLAGLPAARRATSLEAAAAQAQASLNLSDGPLLRAVFFTLGGERGERLLLAVHHLVVDGVSWRILLTDLETAYTQISRGQAVLLPRKTTSFKSWAERLAGHAEELRRELVYWLSGSRMQAARLPFDGGGNHDGAWSPATLSVSLSAEETRRLVQEVPAASRAHVQEVLLAALALALRRWTGKDALLIDMEGHGREEVFGDVDLTRTVGWFTTLFPLLVDLQGESEPGAVLARVQSQVRAVPGRGFGYGVLRYLSPDPEVAERLAVLPPAQVVFNYLGRFDGVAETSSLFHLAPESTGPASSPRLKRKHLLEVGAWVGGGRLEVSFTYLETAHRAATIETLAGDFLASLRTLIALCLAGGPPEVFPPDLSMGIDPKELEEALHEIEFEGMENE